MISIYGDRLNITVSIRKRTIANLHRDHGRRRHNKLFVRYTGETSLRDFDDLDHPKTRAAIEKKYGKLAPVRMHPHAVGIQHFASFLNVLGTKIRCPDDENGRGGYDFGLFQPATDPPQPADLPEKYDFGPHGKG